MNKSTRKTFLFRFTVAVACTAYACVLLVPSRISKKRETEFIQPCATAEYSKAECVMELESRRILYETHGDVRLPMASTTKIATAATVLSLCEDIGTEFAIPAQAEGVEGSSVYLKSGDIYSVEDLLYGLMLRSGNDCATALALYCCGNISNFASKMNETAQRAGAMATNFRNPHGLPCAEHYTTARDLALITCSALENSTFAQIVSTQYYGPRHWKNKNKMLTCYDGAIGVKTGYTKEAGRCLVSAATRSGMTLVCSVLNCPTTYERSACLLDDAFKAYEMVTIADGEQVFQIGEGKNAQKGVLGKSVCYPLLEAEKEWIEMKTFAIEKGNRNADEREIIGKLEIYLAKRLLFSGNLYKL